MNNYVVGSLWTTSSGLKLIVIEQTQSNNKVIPSIIFEMVSAPHKRFIRRSDECNDLVRYEV